jgi:hypothetical protein
MIIVFKEDYVRRLFVDIENELTQVMCLAFVNTKLTTGVLAIHDYADIVSERRCRIDAEQAEQL